MAVVAPAAEEAAVVLLRGLLIPLAVLAGYFVAWGVVFCMDAIVRAFFGTVSGAVGWIPYANRVITAPLHGIEKKLTSFLGGLEAHFEHQMASRWHQLAQLVERFAANAEGEAVAVWQLAHKIAAVYGEMASGKLGARFQKWVEGQLARLHGVTKIVIHTTKVIEHPLTGPIAGGAVAKVAPVARALEHVIEWDLPRLRARDRYLTDQVGRLWRWTRTHGKTVATGAAVGAIAYALGKLGMTWARCSNVRRLGKRVCGMDQSMLDRLLADTLAIVGTVSVIEFVRDAQAVEGVALDALGAFIREMPRG